MNIALKASPTAAVAERPLRVMVVDDSIVARRVLTRWIGAEPDMMIATCVRTGREAVEQIQAANPEVVVLDVDMPELDGISALPLLLKQNRDLVVIMASTLTRRSAEISLRALSLGAADYVPKPEAAPDAATSLAFHRELIEKIRTLGHRRRRLAREVRPERKPARPALAPEAPAPAAGAPIALRPFARSVPRALLIGASTGGPQALTTLIAELGPASDRMPLLITQHMPSAFTTVLAEHLARICGRSVHEARQGEPVVAGGVYLAPGGRHMRVARGAQGATIALGDDAPINFCRPAVDPMLSSAAQVWGAGSLALVLTGMGADGTHGAAEIVAAGGSIIAQDEATSVVWGMPRSVAQAGLCSAVLPLGEIAARINRLLAGDRS